MTKDGIKTEDYREITPYWIGRLMLYDNKPIKKKLAKLIYLNLLVFEMKDANLQFKKFDECIISNGYAKDRPQFIIKNEGVEISKGNKDYGAPEYLIFVIKHGKIKE